MLVDAAKAEVRYTLFTLYLDYFTILLRLTSEAT